MNANALAPLVLAAVMWLVASGSFGSARAIPVGTQADRLDRSLATLFGYITFVSGWAFAVLSLWVVFVSGLEWRP